MMLQMRRAAAMPARRPDGAAASTTPTIALLLLLLLAAAAAQTASAAAAAADTLPSLAPHWHDSLAAWMESGQKGLTARPVRLSGGLLAESVLPPTHLQHAQEPPLGEAAPVLRVRLQLPNHQTLEVGEDSTPGQLLQLLQQQVRTPCPRGGGLASRVPRCGFEGPGRPCALSCPRHCRHLVIAPTSVRR